VLEALRQKIFGHGQFGSLLIKLSVQIKQWRDQSQIVDGCTANLDAVHMGWATG
jgi:hypothetical protein